MNERLLALVRMALGVLFVYAAATKLSNVAAFAEDMANYRILPADWIAPLSTAVLGVEIMAGVAMLIPRLARGAALVLSALLAVFTVALSQALLRRIDLRCGCFGGAEGATWWTVGRDLLLLAAAVAVVLRGAGSLRPTRREQTAS